MRWNWRPVVGVAAVALAVTACGGDTVATTTSTSTSTTTTMPSTTSPPTTTTSVATTTTSLDEEVDDLLVVGDWGSGTLPQGAVAGAMMRYAEDNDVEAILTTGDNFYSDDAEFLMHPFEWANEAGIPFWITWGNHDVASQARISGVDETFDHPPRWTTHRWGNVEVVILDSTQPDSEEQAEFLSETLAGSGLPTIVVVHHPPYSCGTYRDTEGILDGWVSQFDDDVFLVLSGHEHSYQRFEESDVIYVVTGGGGAALTQLSSCPVDHPERVAGEATHHFLVMSQDEGLVVTVVDVNGDAIDEFDLALP